MLSLGNEDNVVTIERVLHTEYCAYGHKYQIISMSMQNAKYDMRNEKE